MVSKEEQRYGRNKDTTVNHTYIQGGEYRKKFDKLTDNEQVNRLLYKKAKEMLLHRSGTLIEDMYWIDLDSSEIVASVLDSKDEQKIIYSESVKKIIKRNKNLITIHTHPSVCHQVLLTLIPFTIIIIVLELLYVTMGAFINIMPMKD